MTETKKAADVKTKKAADVKTKKAADVKTKKAAVPEATAGAVIGGETADTQVAPAEKPTGTSGSLTKAPKSGSVDVIKGANTYVRTFSEDVHGEDYFTLALQLVNKENYATREYRLVDSSLIPEVIVVYREKEDADKPLDKQSPDSEYEDKEQKFEDKDAAIAFSQKKKGAIIVRGLKK